MDDAMPRLSDGLVVLDGFTPEDAERHVAGEDRETEYRFGFPRSSTVDGARAAIAGWQDNWRAGANRRTFAVRDARTGELFGGCELRTPPGRVASVSYWTHRERRGHGIATRALRLLTDYALDVLGIDELEAEIEPNNPASIRVAEKAGFVRRSDTYRETRFAGELRRVDVYQLHRERRRRN